MDYEIRKDGMTISDKMAFDIRGSMLKVGDDAPDFALTATNWSVKTLKDYDGKVKVFSIIPSIDTSVCSTQTRRFNEEAASLSDDIVILAVSADMPYAHRRWCGAEGIEQVEGLSTHKDMRFSDDYGVHVVDLRINQRAVIVVDSNNKVVYTEYLVPMGNEPNYEAAIEAAKNALENN